MTEFQLSMLSDQPALSKSIDFRRKKNTGFGEDFGIRATDPVKKTDLDTPSDDEEDQKKDKKMDSLNILGALLGGKGKLPILKMMTTKVKEGEEDQSPPVSPSKRPVVLSG